MAASPTDLEGFAETGGSEIFSSHEDKIDSLSDSENLTAHIAISSLYNQCIQNLNDLEACSHTHLSELQDLVSRLQIWAGNHGAHRPPNDRLSLDHRLREAPELHREARDHFNEINRALGDAISIASGIALKYLPEDSYSSSSGSDASLTSSQKAFIGVPDSTNEPDGDVKLERLLQNIDAIITSLYKFSITIQNPAHRDRTARATKIDFSFWHDADFRHVRDKFPKCTNQQLLHDLARANTKRRQLFAYHERHKNKIQHFKESNVEEQKYVPKSVPEYRVGYPMSQPSTTKQQTVRTSNTIFTNTTVSTVQQPIAPIPKSISGRSQRTNIVHSSFSESEDLLNIAPLPADSKLYTSPFVCPYCFLVTNPRNFKAWEIHVLDDLRPYSCTFGDCASAEILYDRYSEWESHELEIHRREWFCNFCKAIFDKQDEFLLHLQIQHLELLREVSPKDLASICERISTGNEDCALCEDFTGDVHALQQHLARHMRQLAMHTLPKLIDHESPENHITLKDPAISGADLLPPLGLKDVETFQPKQEGLRPLALPQQVPGPKSGGKELAHITGLSEKKNLDSQQSNKQLLVAIDNFSDVTHQVERDVGIAFKEFAARQREKVESSRNAKRKHDREVTHNDLKIFGATFRLDTPVPSNIEQLGVFEKFPARATQTDGLEVDNKSTINNTQPKEAGPWSEEEETQLKRLKELDKT